MRIRIAIAAVIGRAGIGISQNQRPVRDGVYTAYQSEATKGMRIEAVKPERKE